MPCYDYKCLSCDHIFTINKSMMDDKTPHCPKCNEAEKVERAWGHINLGGMTNKVSSSCSTCSSKNCSTCN